MHGSGVALNISPQRDAYSETTFEYRGQSGYDIGTLWGTDLQNNSGKRIQAKESTNRRMLRLKKDFFRSLESIFEFPVLLPFDLSQGNLAVGLK